MKNLLDLCLKLTQLEYAYIYCYVNGCYTLIQSVHLNENPDHELICTYFNFDKETMLSASDAKGKFTSKGFVIREIAVNPIFSEKEEKLGILVLGSGLDQKKDPSTIIKKDKLSRRKKHISSPSITEDFLVHETIFDKLSPVKPLLSSFLEVEKYKYLYENKIVSGSEDFSPDLLITSMSREIRTPLNGIIGFVQLLSRTNLDQTQNKYISSMNHCCFQLMKAVNDILDYARLNTIKVDLHEESVSIQDLVGTIQDILKISLRTKNQTLTFRISKKIPDFLYTDKDKVMQVLLNLLSNAQKFSPEKTEIKVRVKMRSDDMLLFEVNDQGNGISEEDKETLFHFSVQVQNNRTCLGLAIAKKIVELMGGIIWVKSVAGEGSTFYFTIKITRCEDIEKIMINNLPLIKGKYVLIVDDNSTNRMLFSDMFYEWQMIPIPCASVVEAIRLIINKRYAFSVALIDVCKPEMNGVDLAKLIKEEHPQLPLIAMSSEEINRDENFNCYLDKPIHKLELFNTILKLMNTEIAQVQHQIDGMSVSKINQYEQRILIAENMSYNLTLMVNILNSLEYKSVDTAHDGQDVIEKLDKAHEKEKPYDILLLDLKIPRTNGIGVIKHIKEKDYKIKIAVIGAPILQEEKDTCAEVGIEFFVPNPVEIKKLKDVISQLAIRK